MSECTGLIFKGRESSYWDGKSLCHKESLTLLKRKSCKCETCFYITTEAHDLFTDALSCIFWDFTEKPIKNDVEYKLILEELSDYAFDFHFIENKKN